MKMKEFVEILKNDIAEQSFIFGDGSFVLIETEFLGEYRKAAGNLPAALSENLRGVYLSLLLPNRI